MHALILQIIVETLFFCLQTHAGGELRAVRARVLELPPLAAAAHADVVQEARFCLSPKKKYNPRREMKRAAASGGGSQLPSAAALCPGGRRARRRGSGGANFFYFVNNKFIDHEGDTP